MHLYMDFLIEEYMTCKIGTLVKKFFFELTVKLYLVNMWLEKILIVKEVEDNVPLE